jgi:non-heme chloroperoxidase
MKIGPGARDLRTMSMLLVFAAPASAQQTEWRDESRHVTRFVTVADSVQLEVLDWGGSGPVLVLLAGLGDTGHVFDDFAPMLSGRYRVLCVTRRGHGRSSAPHTGYGFERLAEDVVRVIDAMGVDKPVVVGHSFAGEELHVLGARHAGKVAALVYIDAAFNRADGSEDYDAAVRALPAAPRPSPADLSSFASLRSFLERTQGPAGPEAHLRARYSRNADGTVAGPWVPELPIRQALSTSMQAAYKAYNPEPIRQPALAMYAVPRSAADLMRVWYDADDSTLREAVQRLFMLARERFGRHKKWFETFAERGRVIEISGRHHLFIDSPRDVMEQIDAFVSSLSGAR